LAKKDLAGLKVGIQRAASGEVWIDQPPASRGQEAFGIAEDQIAAQVLRDQALG